MISSNERDIPDPECENGTMKNNICCMKTCGICGGSDCATKKGGTYGCCGGSIMKANRSCDVYSAPCIMSGANEFKFQYIVGILNIMMIHVYI